jgi:hypothetical protein
MSAVLSALVPIAVFLAGLAVLYVTGPWRPQPGWLRPRKALDTWKTAPARRMLAGFVLMVVFFIVRSVTETAYVWAVPLFAAGAVFTHTGVGITRNVDGWADTLARLTWTEQGIHVPNPRRAARIEGAVGAFLGSVFMFFAVVNVIVGS